MGMLGVLKLVLKGCLGYWGGTIEALWAFSGEYSDFTPEALNRYCTGTEGTQETQAAVGCTLGYSRA